MKFNIKALALACAILWGLVMLVMGLANLIWSGYGQQFLQTIASVYFGLPTCLASRIFSPPILTLICLGFASAFLASLMFSTPLT